MKLTTLTNAIRHYIASGNCSPNELNDALDALTSLNSVYERIDEHNAITDCVAVVTIGVLTDMLNNTTYDVYGKLARRHDGYVRFEDYARDVRRDVGVCSSELTNEQLAAGYDVVRDLWSVNDEDGSNNTDGTFKKNDANSEMTRDAYLRYIESLACEDKIDDDAFDTMYRLAPND